jgi:hypothetical protein
MQRPETAGNLAAVVIFLHATGAFVGRDAFASRANQSPSVYRIFERFASAELRHLGGLDLDRGPGARIAAAATT